MLAAYVAAASSATDDGEVLKVIGLVAFLVVMFGLPVLVLMRDARKTRR